MHVTLSKQSENAKLRELLNVKPKCKCKTEDKAKKTEAICKYISDPSITDKEVNGCMI